LELIVVPKYLSRLRRGFGLGKVPRDIAAIRWWKPKLTDAERHKRFVDMAHEVEADESPEAFERAFANVVTHSGGETTTQNEHPLGQQKAKT
jgi:hypothetical protein